jgi:hypothetical protein
MRGLRLLSEFASWRWAPTVALIGATLLYILLVLLIVPSEIGLPGMNTKFVPRGSHGAGSAADAGSPFSFGAGRETSPTATATGESEPLPPPVPAQPVIPPQAPGNFGSRGFSPPLPREEAPQGPAIPQMPEAPPPQPPTPDAAPPPAVIPTAENPVPVQPEPAPEAAPPAPQ